jgi:hypothetical protein
VRYLIRDREGRELTVPSLADLSHLYRHGLLGEDDLVRTATGARWVRAGDMPALAGHREQRREWRTILAVLAAAVALVAALALLLRGR